MSEHKSARTRPDAARYKRAVSEFPSGITLVTGRADSTPLGLTLQSFSSLSLDPLLVVIAVARSSTTWPQIAATGCFAVNILTDGHTDLALRFAKSGGNKYREEARFELSPHGNPVLNDAASWLDCRIESTHLAGDHALVVGRVLAISPESSDGRRPLLYHRSSFAAIADT